VLSLSHELFIPVEGQASKYSSRLYERLFLDIDPAFLAGDERKKSNNYQLLARFSSLELVGQRKEQARSRLNFLPISNIRRIAA
jgi:hypothetical protein